MECLPQEIPARVVVDISGLAEIGDTIHVSDIRLPGEVEILTDPEEVIVSATAPKVEEVVEEVVEEEEGAEPEVAKGGKKEEERNLFSIPAHGGAWRTAVFLSAYGMTCCLLETQMRDCPAPVLTSGDQGDILLKD